MVLGLTQTGHGGRTDHARAAQQYREGPAKGCVVFRRQMLLLVERHTALAVIAAHGIGTTAKTLHYIAFAPDPVGLIRCAALHGMLEQLFAIHTNLHRDIFLPLTGQFYHLQAQCERRLAAESGKLQCVFLLRQSR